MANRSYRTVRGLLHGPEVQCRVVFNKEVSAFETDSTKIFQFVIAVVAAVVSFAVLGKLFILSGGVDIAKSSSHFPTVVVLIAVFMEVGLLILICMSKKMATKLVCLLGFFSLMLGVSAANIIGGIDYCDCAGVVSTPSWVSLVFNLIVFAILLAIKFADICSRSSASRSAKLSARFMTVILTCAILGCGTFAFALTINSSTKSISVHSSELSHAIQLFLPPETMEKSGDIDVLFYKPDCRNCDEFLQRYVAGCVDKRREESSLVLMINTSDNPLARLWCPPMAASVIHGNLSGEVRFTIPLLARFRGGTVEILTKNSRDKFSSADFLTHFEGDLL